MPEPIIENVEQNLEDSLNTIRLSAGYSCDLLTERVREGGNDIKDNFCLIIGDDWEDIAEKPVRKYDTKTPFVLLVYLASMANIPDAPPKSQRVYRLARDIKVALMGANGEKQNRGGWAHGTKVYSPRAFTEEDGQSGFTMLVEIEVRTDEFDLSKP